MLGTNLFGVPCSRLRRVGSRCAPRSLAAFPCVRFSRVHFRLVSGHVSHVSTSLAFTGIAMAAVASQPA